MIVSFALITQIGGWWDGLDLGRQIFYGLGLAAGAVSLLLAALSFAGLEHHDVLDAAGAMDLDHGGGGIFSVKPLTGFFLGFGWVGGMALDAGQSMTMAIIAAGAAGGTVMAVVILMFRTIYSLRSDGTVRIQEAVGAVGTVYITVPARKGPGGQVIVNFSGRQETLAAITGAEAPIASGEKVKVLSLVDSRTALVEPL